MVGIIKEEEWVKIIPEELKWRNWAHAQNGEQVLTDNEFFDFQ